MNSSCNVKIKNRMNKSSTIMVAALQELEDRKEGMSFATILDYILQIGEKNIKHMLI